MRLGTRPVWLCFTETEQPRPSTQIYVSTNPKDIETLRESISIIPPQGWFRCACGLLTVIRLFNRNRNIGEIDLFADTTIRFTNWSSDAEISNTAVWFEWLDRRGIKAPREAFDQEVAQGRKNRAAEERRMNAMPSSLVPLWSSVSKEIPMGEHETDPFDSALSKQFPDKDARILYLWPGLVTEWAPGRAFQFMKMFPSRCSSDIQLWSWLLLRQAGRLMKMKLKGLLVYLRDGTSTNLAL